MKKLILCVIAVLVGMTAVGSEFKPFIPTENMTIDKIIDGPEVPIKDILKEDKWSAELTISAVSMYADTRAGNLWHEKPCLQADIFVSMPFNLYIDLWGSMSTNGKKEGDWGDEIDFALGWKPSFWGFDFDFSIAMWDVCDLFTWGRYDVATSTVDVSKTLNLSRSNSLTIGVASEYLWEIKGNFEGLGDGWYNWIYLTHSWNILKWLKLENHIRVVHDDGYAGTDVALIGHHKVSLKAQLSERYSVGVFMSTFTPLTGPLHVNSLVGPDDERDTQEVFGIEFGCLLF